MNIGDFFFTLQRKPQRTEQQQPVSRATLLWFLMRLVGKNSARNMRWETESEQWLNLSLCRKWGELHFIAGKSQCLHMFKMWIREILCSSFHVKVLILLLLTQHSYEWSGWGCGRFHAPGIYEPFYNVLNKTNQAWLWLDFKPSNLLNHISTVYKISFPHKHHVDLTVIRSTDQIYTLKVGDPEIPPHHLCLSVAREWNHVACAWRTPWHRQQRMGDMFQHQ